MSNETRLLALFEEANPVPDEYALESDIEPAAYLATLQERSSEVTQVETRPTEEARPRRNRLIAVAAVLLVIVGTAVFLLTQPGEEAPVATDPPQEPEVEAIMTAIDTLFDTFNRSDIEAYVAAYEDDLLPSWSYQGEIRYYAEIWMNANGQFTVVEPCQQAAPPDGHPVFDPILGYVPVFIECVIAFEDDWFGPAELFDNTRRVTLEVAPFEEWESADLPLFPFGPVNANMRSYLTPLEDELLTGVLTGLTPADDVLGKPGRSRAAGNYAFAFWEWLEQEHPDVYTEIEPEVRALGVRVLGGIATSPGVQRDPADMLIALQYVDEFIAQSDDYPIENNE